MEGRGEECYIHTYRQTYRPSDEVGCRGAFAPKKILGGDFFVVERVPTAIKLEGGISLGPIFLYMTDHAGPRLQRLQILRVTIQTSG